MLNTNIYDQLIDQLILAYTMTFERIERFPHYPLFQHARKQLDQISEHNLNSTIPSAIDKASIDLSIMAVKELEADDPVYADVLCKVEYLFEILG